ncbi:uncharacterized protein [Misgurnus anguillicaudatus]|uniref:uncharacterized protein n=1 Tax=Misgurnus anguillicaudatus TaxID=75329 RepID=UPI003CCF0414
MAFANFKVTQSQQLVMRASGEAVAFVAAKGPRGTAAAAAAAAAKAKKPEEVEKEAQALVVSKGGDPGNGMLVLGCYSIQFGMYRGQTFRWLLENDVGYTTQLVASHQREREKSASNSPLMANKDALVRYSCAHPAFVEQLRFHRVYEEARARASQPGCEGEALVGFGEYKEVTLKDLYSSEKKKHQNFVKYLRRTTPQPGTTMSTAKMYILAQDKKRSAEAAAPPLPPTTSSGPSKAASTTLPPQKPIASMLSGLLGKRPMAPGKLQAEVRKLMSTSARPAVPAVSTSVRDQRPSVPPPTTEVTDEELIQMATDLETVVTVDA